MRAGLGAVERLIGAAPYPPPGGAGFGGIDGVPSLTAVATFVVKLPEALDVEGRDDGDVRPLRVLALLTLAPAAAVATPSALSFFLRNRPPKRPLLLLEGATAELGSTLGLWLPLPCCGGMWTFTVPLPGAGCRERPGVRSRRRCPAASVWLLAAHCCTPVAASRGATAAPQGLMDAS